MTTRDGNSLQGAVSWSWTSFCMTFIKKQDRQRGHFFYFGKSGCTCTKCVVSKRQVELNVFFPTIIIYSALRPTRPVLLIIITYVEDKNIFSSEPQQSDAPRGSPVMFSTTNCSTEWFVFPRSWTSLSNATGFPQVPPDLHLHEKTLLKKMTKDGDG